MRTFLYYNVILQQWITRNDASHFTVTDRGSLVFYAGGSFSIASEPPMAWTALHEVSNTNVSQTG